MNTLKCIAEKLLEAKKVLIYPHIRMDADALGSSVALCLGLRSLGIEAMVHIEDEVGVNLRFLEHRCCTMMPEFKADTAICIDCSGESRIPNRYEIYRSADVTLCVDHHKTAEYFADYNFIDPDAEATAGIVFELLKLMRVNIDKEMAEAIYAGISADTGSFKYSNTKASTHNTVAELYNYGINHNYVCNELYESNSYESLVLESMVMNTLERFADGKSAIAYVTQEMLRDSRAGLDETDAIVPKIRAIRGVEIAAFLKEEADGKIKVSMRAKDYGDVASIAQEFGGGGHIKAAGCTLNCCMEEAKAVIMTQIEKQFI